MSEREDAKQAPSISVKRPKNATVLVRVTIGDGVEWTVYDVTWSNKKHHRCPHGDPTAMERVFVNQQGVKRVYRFKPSDTRILEAQALARQLMSAAYMPSMKDALDAQELAGQRITPTFDRKEPASSTDNQGLHGLSDAPGG